MDFSFNNTLLFASSVKLPITTIGANFPLTLDTYTTISTIVGLVSFLIGIIISSLGLFTSFFGKKLLGF